MLHLARYARSAAAVDPQYEALGNNFRVCGDYSPGPRAEVYEELSS